MAGKKKKKRQADEDYNDFQNDMFYFIAGYTSGGAPYGITWEEMGLDPFENELDNSELTEIKELYAQSIMLESERLIFRKITNDDFDDLAEMLRDSEVMRAWEHTFTDEQIYKWIDNQLMRYRDHNVGYFAAIDKDTGEFIGQMGLMWSDFDGLRALEIGYMLKRKFWGNGYAAEGTEALAQYAFTEIGVNKVYTAIRSLNEKSIHVAENAGMVAEGIFNKQYNGKSMEHIIYSKSCSSSSGQKSK